MLAVTLASVAQSSVIRRSTIDNPCHADSTSTANNSFQSLPHQINATIIAARVAKSTCEGLKDILSSHLTDLERRDLDSQPINISGLTTMYGAASMTQANVFTRAMRHSAFNITLLYKFIERIVASARVPQLESVLRNVMASMAQVKCRVILTSETKASTFTDQERDIENEMILVDYDLFVDVSLVVDTVDLPEDSRSICTLVYKLVRCMQAYTVVLEETLQFEMNSQHLN